VNEKRKGNVYVEVHDRREGMIVSGEWVSTIEAIHRMQNAIVLLRRNAHPSFDPSWWEQPQAILAPSEEEARGAVMLDGYMNPETVQLEPLRDRVLRCDCKNEKTPVDCDLRHQQVFDQKEACRYCYPELVGGPT